jgi:hypothetical protein
VAEEMAPEVRPQAVAVAVLSQMGCFKICQITSFIMGKPSCVYFNGPWPEQTDHQPSNLGFSPWM